MLTCVVLQGPPGGGKSWVAHNLIAPSLGRRVAVFSTDDYYTDACGRYNFVVADIQKAHAWNQERARRALADGYSVVIDNTNTRAWEARPYVEAAVARKARVVFLRCTGRFANVHGVPHVRVAEMRSQMEDLTVEACLAAVPPWQLPFCPVI